MFNQKTVCYTLLFCGCLWLVTGCVSTKKYKEALHQKDIMLANQLSNQHKIAAYVEENTILRKDTGYIWRDYRQLQLDYDSLLKKNELAGIQLKKKKKALKQEQKKHEKLKQQMNEQLAEQSANLAEMEQQLTNVKQQDIQKEKEMQLLTQNIQEQFIGFPEKQLHIQQQGNKIHVVLATELFFQPKRATLTLATKGKKALKQIAKTIGKYPQLHTTIVGHTDQTPYQPPKPKNTNKSQKSSSSLNSPLLKKPGMLIQEELFKREKEKETKIPTTQPDDYQVIIEDNWDLSTQRAATLIRKLIQSYQIAGSKLTAAAQAEYAPIASTHTPEGRQKNNRIELIFESIYDIPEQDVAINLLPTADLDNDTSDANVPTSPVPSQSTNEQEEDEEW